jgi:hypothetical protein
VLKPIQVRSLPAGLVQPGCGPSERAGEYFWVVPWWPDAESKDDGQAGAADDQLLRISWCPHADGQEYRLVCDLDPVQYRSFDLRCQQVLQFATDRAAGVSGSQPSQ